MTLAEVYEQYRSGKIDKAEFDRLRMQVSAETQKQLDASRTPEPVSSTGLQEGYARSTHKPEASANRLDAKSEWIVERRKELIQKGSSIPDANNQAVADYAAKHEPNATRTTKVTPMEAFGRALQPQTLGTMVDASGRTPTSEEYARALLAWRMGLDSSKDAEKIKALDVGGLTEKIEKEGINEETLRRFGGWMSSPRMQGASLIEVENQVPFWMRAVLQPASSAAGEALTQLAGLDRTRDVEGTEKLSPSNIAKAAYRGDTEELKAAGRAIGGMGAAASGAAPVLSIFGYDPIAATRGEEAMSDEEIAKARAERGRTWQASDESMLPFDSVNQFLVDIGQAWAQGQGVADFTRNVSKQSGFYDLPQVGPGPQAFTPAVATEVMSIGSEMAVPIAPGVGVVGKMRRGNELGKIAPAGSGKELAKAAWGRDVVTDVGDIIGKRFDEAAREGAPPKLPRQMESDVEDILARQFGKRDPDVEMGVIPDDAPLKQDVSELNVSGERVKADRTLRPQGIGYKGMVATPDRKHGSPILADMTKGAFGLNGEVNPKQAAILRDAYVEAYKRRARMTLGSSELKQITKNTVLSKPEAEYVQRVVDDMLRKEGLGGSQLFKGGGKTVDLTPAQQASVEKLMRQAGYTEYKVGSLSPSLHRQIVDELLEAKAGKSAHVRYALATNTPLRDFVADSLRSFRESYMRDTVGEHRSRLAQWFQSGVGPSEIRNAKMATPVRRTIQEGLRSMERTPTELAREIRILEQDGQSSVVALSTLLGDAGFRMTPDELDDLNRLREFMRNGNAVGMSKRHLSSPQSSMSSGLKLDPSDYANVGRGQLSILRRRIVSRYGNNLFGHERLLLREDATKGQMFRAVLSLQARLRDDAMEQARDIVSAYNPRLPKEIRTYDEAEKVLRRFYANPATFGDSSHVAGVGAEDGKVAMFNLLVKWVNRTKEKNLYDELLDMDAAEVGGAGNARTRKAIMDLATGKSKHIDESGLFVKNEVTGFDHKRAVAFFERYGIESPPGSPAVTRVAGTRHEMMLPSIVEDAIKQSQNRGLIPAQRGSGRGAMGMVQNIERFRKQMLLTGPWFAPNAGYMAANFMSAPFIMLNTLGVQGTARAGMQWVKNPKLCSRVMVGLSDAPILHALGTTVSKEIGNGLSAKGGRFYTESEIIQLAKQYGIDTSHVRTDTARSIVQELQLDSGGVFAHRLPWLDDKIQRAYRFSADRQQDLQEMVNATDSFYRVSVFIDALEDGVDPAVAAEQARKALYDYGAMTDTERKWFRLAFTFWSWTRSNVVGTAKAAAEDPSRISKAYLVQMSMREAQYDNNDLGPIEVDKFTEGRIDMFRTGLRQIPDMNEDRYDSVVWQMAGGASPLYDAAHKMVQMANIVSMLSNPEQGMESVREVGSDMNSVVGLAIEAASGKQGTGADWNSPTAKANQIPVAFVEMDEMLTGGRMATLFDIDSYEEDDRQKAPTGRVFYARNRGVWAWRLFTTVFGKQTRFYETVDRAILPGGDEARPYLGPAGEMATLVAAPRLIPTESEGVDELMRDEQRSQQAEARDMARKNRMR